MRTLIALALALFATTSSAEVPPPSVLPIGSGVLCDLEEDLQIVLTEASLNDGRWPEDMRTCGRFVPRSPQLAIVTPLYWYELPDVRVLFVKLYFEPVDWTQYGWIASEAKDVLQPTGDSL